MKADWTIISTCSERFLDFGRAGCSLMGDQNGGHPSKKPRIQHLRREIAEGLLPAATTVAPLFIPVGNKGFGGYHFYT
jgi:hypothetical protein